jgi:hypothetical protein
MPQNKFSKTNLLYNLSVYSNDEVKISEYFDHLNFMLQVFRDDFSPKYFTEDDDNIDIKTGSQKYDDSTEEADYQEFEQFLDGSYYYELSSKHFLYFSLINCYLIAIKSKEVKILLSFLFN